MKKFVRKAKMIGYIFGRGVVLQSVESSSVGIATTVGLYQGLKYNGSLARGVKAAGATLAVLCTFNGVNMVIRNIDAIKQA